MPQEKDYMPDSSETKNYEQRDVFQITDPKKLRHLRKIHKALNREPYSDVPLGPLLQQRKAQKKC